MNKLTVLYDPTCGLCRRAHEWLLEQPKFVSLAFVPCDSAQARHLFPNLNHALTTRDLTVISEDGAVYFGPKGWLMVLWSLHGYREWSYRLSSPELLGTTRQVVSLISRNRHQLSRVAGL